MTPVIMTGLKTNRIMQSLKVIENQKDETIRQVADYSMPNVSEKVLRIIFL